MQEKNREISVSESDVIEIKGARLHNLKHIDVKIPRKEFVVITGVSGSGKSSLAFDTLYAEGQRRYVESLSSYARQFLGRLNKPEVDYIKGLSPAVAIEQKVNTRNPRSTVGTSTEIYEYIKLLFARAGKTFSPISGKEVKRDKPTDIANFISNLPLGTKCLLLCKIKNNNNRSWEDTIKVLSQQGYTRVLYKGEIVRTDDPDFKKIKKNRESILLLIDRVKVSNEEKLKSRVADSASTAFYEGDGFCSVQYEIDGEKKEEFFSNKFEMDGITFEEPSVNLFTFNNPYGACKRCEGFGSVIDISEELVIPNPNLSVFDGTVACWKGEKMEKWKDQVVDSVHISKFPIHRPYVDLTAEERKILWKGCKHFQGIDDFFKMVEENSYKIQYRVMLARYRGKTICKSCGGTRLREDANYVKVAGLSIKDMMTLSIDDLLQFFKSWKPEQKIINITERLQTEITQRVGFLSEVGLGYLTLNRMSNSLSGGESQRINLATSLGSSLVGSIYILDEPSIGLHPSDTQRLINILKNLRDIGNSVVVVEHDEEIIKAADTIIDIGPEAGRFGGELVFQGTFKELIEQDKGLTAGYFNNRLRIELPAKRRKWNDYITIKGAEENNLKNIDIDIPLNTITSVCGVSGSGKSTLIRHILYPALKKKMGDYGNLCGKYKSIEGSINSISAIEMIDQNPIGRSSRSNPATYVGAWDEIRQLFANQPLSKVRGYTPGFFSFNVKGGRCENCEGAGTIKIEMQFMADVHLVCDECGGKRFKQEMLDIKYRDIDIYSLLQMTIDDAMTFFEPQSNSYEKKIYQRLKPLQDTGLGYLQLGQASSTLSGGEAQRIKLAYFLSKGASNSPTLFVFDEPTTGLHFHDINKLIKSINALVDRGHSAIIIEHNIEVLKLSDWIIELGPVGGEKGGNHIFSGTPEELAKKDTPTSKFIRDKVF